jgi:sulfate adenylyltransferase
MHCLRVDKRIKCDIELLLSGALNPLDGFMLKEDYESVVENMLLSNGELFPLPIILRLTELQYNEIKDFEIIKLVDELDYPIALFYPLSYYKIDVEYECNKVYGTTNELHPYVFYLKKEKYEYGAGGRLESCDKPDKIWINKDISQLQITPKEMKKKILENGWKNVLAFQTRNPLHRSHVEMTIRAWKTLPENTLLWINPVIGITQDGDINDIIRLKCYTAILNEYPKDIPLWLSTLGLNMRMAGPREAILHALIRANYGATHFIVGRDHASPSFPKGLYGSYDAHNLLKSVRSKLKINILYMENMVYIPEMNEYKTEKEAKESGREYIELSGTELRNILKKGDIIPSWYTFSSIANILQTMKSVRGLCIYLVGLSGSGKTTIGSALKDTINGIKENSIISFLDGDDLRSRWKYPLGFRREDRSLQARMMGVIASEIVKHGGICIVANIAPYQDDRIENRKCITRFGDYIQIYIKTPISECMRRDKKGLYEKAKYGEIQLTGVNDPFDEPEDSDIIIDGMRPLYEIIYYIMKSIKIH